MSDGLMITIVICMTLIAITYLGSKDNNKK